MQNVICAIKNCGYCSVNGFCLNRVVKINENGVCSFLTRQGWEQQIEEKYKSVYNPWKTREPVQTPAQIGTEQNQDQNESGKDRPPREEQN